MLCAARLKMQYSEVEYKSCTLHAAFFIIDVKEATFFGGSGHRFKLPCCSGYLRMADGRLFRCLRFCFFLSRHLSLNVGAELVEDGTDGSQAYPDRCPGKS
jgi:hypothetical protein